MDAYLNLSDIETALLAQALETPLIDLDEATQQQCQHLCGKRLLQRAGSASLANGWVGSPHAFVLTQRGWNLLKADRLRTPVRRAG